VDILGSEYGWSKKQILEETYFDEYIEYCFAIKKRLFSHYQILLAISHNPHVEEPSKLQEAFRERVDGISSYGTDESASLDKAGFGYLKSVMANNPRIVIK